MEALNNLLREGWQAMLKLKMTRKRLGPKRLIVHLRKQALSMRWRRMQKIQHEDRRTPRHMPMHWQNA